ncbi:MAG TPA: polysaccharide deacetylase family protein [Candidatus Nitrosopolaris sp.]|nr:polysaccharide deacetylase family protein [Candidatus Nitrosopolaris sp.]
MRDIKNNNFKILFSITLALSISFLFLFSIQQFSVTHILAIGHSNYAITNPSSNHSNTIGLMNNSSENNKVVILTFGDTVKSQFTTAKPILDQYGYKASFFITCNYVGQTQRMNWNDILSLQKDGQDIESKGMTRADLNSVSSSSLDFEIGGSKQCLQTHGINSPNIFAVVHGNAWNNPSVIDTISKYYAFADNGFATSMFLRCDGYSTNKQTDCATYDNSGTLSYANRYSIREASHNSWDQSYLHNNQTIFQKFIGAVKSGINFNNKKGALDAIPIVAYHGIDNTGDPSSTDVSLFAAEMKYLHDNGFKVIPMSDLGYNENTNSMYIRQ